MRHFDHLKHEKDYISYKEIYHYDYNSLLVFFAGIVQWNVLWNVLIMDTCINYFYKTILKSILFYIFFKNIYISMANYTLHLPM